MSCLHGKEVGLEETRAFTIGGTEEQTKTHEETSKCHFISVKANNRSGAHPTSIYFAAPQPNNVGSSLERMTFDSSREGLRSRSPSVEQWNIVLSRLQHPRK